MGEAPVPTRGAVSASRLECAGPAPVIVGPHGPLVAIKLWFSAQGPTIPSIAFEGPRETEGRGLTRHTLHDLIVTVAVR